MKSCGRLWRNRRGHQRHHGGEEEEEATECCMVMMEGGEAYDEDPTGVDNDMVYPLRLMDPKELYLSDLSCHTKDSTSSASDSGISNLDDVADYENMTDLHLDAPLDFSFDFDAMIKSENGFETEILPEDFAHVVNRGGQDLPTEYLHSEIVEDYGAVVKSEPISPSASPLGSETELSDTAENLCGLHQSPISPDLYSLYNDNSLVGMDSSMSPLILSNQHHYRFIQELQQQPVPLSDYYSPEHGCTVQSSPYSPTSNTASPSPTSSTSSGLMSPAVATVISASKFSLAPQQHYHQQSVSKPLILPTKPDVNKTLSSTNPRKVLVVPHVKQEASSSSPSSPISVLSISSPSSSPSLPSHHAAGSTFSIIPMASKPPAAVNLNSILSSKKKIQPKPGFDNVATTGQWINTSGLSQVPLTTQPIGVAPGSVITSAPIVSNGAITSLTDSKSIKRAQRIIKNRESASLSRKRKKEYLTSLEERLQVCVDENNRLQRENQDLKQQLESLQSVNNQLKSPVVGLSPAKKVCLMCFTLFLVINISGFGFLQSSSIMGMSPPDIEPSSHRTGRQLLSLPLTVDREKTSRVPSMSEDRLGRSSWLEKAFGSSWKMHDELTMKMLMEKMNLTQAKNLCASMAYINATESNRLAEKLTGWMVQQEEEKKRKKEEKKPVKKIPRKKYYPTLRRFNAAPAARHIQSLAPLEMNSIEGGNSYSLQVFKGPDQRQQFLNAIPRRNDTFYVLSFSTDYFLVPATAHNKTMRPRMSLLMPVLSPSLNDSMKEGDDSVAMMQIDCEILNTNLIHVHRSAFPRGATPNATRFEDISPASQEGSHDIVNKTASDNYWAKLKENKK